MSEYGDKFETPTIIAMSLIIILSLAAVIAMNVAYFPHCHHSYTTYCPQEANDHH